MIGCWGSWQSRIQRELEFYRMKDWFVHTKHFDEVTAGHQLYGSNLSELEMLRAILQLIRRSSVICLGILGPELLLPQIGYDIRLILSFQGVKIIKKG